MGDRPHRPSLLRPRLHHYLRPAATDARGHDLRREPALSRRTASAHRADRSDRRRCGSRGRDVDDAAGGFEVGGADSDANAPERNPRCVMPGADEFGKDRAAQGSSGADSEYPCRSGEEADNALPRGETMTEPASPVATRIIL